MMLPVLLILLPAAVLLMLLLPERLKQPVSALAGAGLLCLTGGFPAFLCGMLLVSGGWLTVRLMPGTEGSLRKRRLRCLVGTGVQLLLLLAAKLLLSPLQLLPLVICAMQNLLLVFSRFYGEMPLPGLLPYCCCVLDLPRLFAGPVLDWHGTKQLTGERKLSLQNFGAGASLFTGGLFQAVLLALPLSALWNALTAEAVMKASLDACTAGAALFLAFYFGLKGLSEAGRGIGLMAGLSYPAQFDRPFRGTALSAFFERVFPCVKQWNRRVLLAGLAEGDTASYFSRVLLFCGMLGFLLGESWCGLLWGLVTAILLTFRHRHPAKPERRALQRFLTALAVLLPLPLLRCGSFSGISAFYSALFGRGGVALSAAARAVLSGKLPVLLAAAVFLFPLRDWLRALSKKHAWIRVAACILLPLMQLAVLLLAYAELYSVSVRT